MITSSNTMALNNHCATALGPRLGLGLRLDFGSQVWFVQYFSENLVVVLYASFRRPVGSFIFLLVKFALYSSAVSSCLTAFQILK
jgi:hypothetical protein